MAVTLDQVERLTLSHAPSVYAERFRRIRVGGEDVPYRFDGYEFLQEIHDTLAERVIVQKCSQVGCTETMVNRNLHVQHVLHLDSMHLFPASDEATDFSAGRYQVAVDESPDLAGLYTAVDNKGHRQTNDGANAFFRGGGSRSKVKSHPISLLLIDEYDDIRADIVELARERLSGQDRYRWEVCGSTPSVPERGIAKAYKGTDRRRWRVACPHCHARTTLDVLRGRGDSLEILLAMRDGQPSTLCLECGGVVTEEAARTLLPRGRWEATAPDADVPGFQVTGLMSPRRRWAYEIRALATAMEDPDPLVLKEHMNGHVGIPWVEAGHQVDRDTLVRLSRQYGVRSGPRDQVHYTVAGVDAGVRRHYATVLAVTDDGLRPLEARKCATLEDLHAMLVQYEVRHLVVDAQPNTEASRKLQRRLWDQGVESWLCYYSESMKGRAKWDMDHQDGPQVVVHRTELLNEAMGALSTGECVYPVDVSPEVLDHVVAMRRVTREAADGNLRTVWEADGADHYAHSLAYAWLALDRVARSRDTADEQWTDHGIEGEDDTWEL